MTTYAMVMSSTPPIVWSVLLLLLSLRCLLCASSCVIDWSLDDVTVASSQRQWRLWCLRCRLGNSSARSSTTCSRSCPRDTTRRWSRRSTAPRPRCSSCWHAVPPSQSITSCCRLFGRWCGPCYAAPCSFRWNTDSSAHLGNGWADSASPARHYSSAQSCYRLPWPTQQ